MELGEPDASGRRRPVPIEGSEYEIDVDIAVIAIGGSRLVLGLFFFGGRAADQGETTDTDDHQERCELLHLTTFS